MKNYLLLFFLAFVFSNFAQQICTPDLSQTQTGIYPDTLPDGFVGQAYSTDVTFRLPLDTLGYDFTNFHILSVSLPVGLSWQCNNVASNCDYNPQVNQNGCVNVYGTPLLPGMYPVEITVIADLTIIQGYPFTFQIYMEVLPSNATISNNGFTMTGPTGCFPITVGFTNNNTGLLAYQWNFGNGNTSTLSQPVDQIYSLPGQYVVEYSAVVTNPVYALASIEVVSGTCIDNFLIGDVDLFYSISTQSGSIQQVAINNANTQPFPLFININNPPQITGQSVTVEVWDDDSPLPLFPSIESCGTHTFTPLQQAGTHSANGGGLSINYTVIELIPANILTSTDTINVYGYPPNPLISYDQISNTISTPNLPYGYQWYVNGSPISGANDTSHVVTLSGVYSVIAINPSGCVSFSDTMTVVFCAPFTPPLISNSTNGNLIVTNVPVGFSIAWALNGVLIAGATSQTYSPTSNGVYSVIITDIYNCSISSDDFNLAVGINELSNSDWKIFPNPGNQQIEISVKSNLIGAQCELMDLSGRQLDSFTLIESSLQINTDNLPSGSYFINLKMEGLSTSKKLIILH
jgi:hypothetical protein